MIGDPDAIRDLAGMLRTRADDVRAEGDRLVAHSVAVDWQGRAGDAMRVAVADAVGGLRKTADLHDHAADALVRHAEAVESVLRLAADATHVIEHLGHAAASLVGWAA